MSLSIIVVNYVHHTSSSYYPLYIFIAMAKVQLEPTTQVICNGEAEYTCRVTASGFIRWTVGDISMSFLSTDVLNVFVNRSDNNGEYKFALTAVERNTGNSRLFDFTSALRVNATSAVNGTILECDDGVSSPAEEPLILNSSEYKSKSHILM